MIFYYESNLKNSDGQNTIVDFLKAPFRAVETDIFDSEWTATASGYDKKIEIDVFGQDGFIKNMNQIYNALAYDAENGEYGKLWVNGTYILCNVKKSQKTGWKGNIYAYITLTFHAPKLEWIEEERRVFFKNASIESYGKGYPYDYAYDYAPPQTGNNLWNVDHIADNDFSIIIHGAVDNPSITINGYEYRMNSSLSEGDYLIIDSQSRKIIKNVGGALFNAFDERNVEQSVFQKIPSGLINVAWSGGFTFEITLYKVRREPRWM